MSARIIGREFGKTAAEMNKTLAQYGYLEGAPGLWRVSPKGGEYAHEKDEHRGTGGYAHYNRDWAVTTYDESIVDALRADIATNPNPTVIDYSNPAEEEAPAEHANTVVAEERGGLTDKQKVLLLVASLAATAYGAKKLLPRAKRGWSKYKDRHATSPAATDGPTDASGAGPITRD